MLSGAGGAVGGAGRPAGDGVRHLDHADRRGSGHGHDAVPDGLRADAGLRPDGRAQLRPRRFITLGAYVAVSVLAALAGWVEAASWGPNLAALGAAAAAAAVACGGVGLAVRAGHRAPRVRVAPAADPDHDGRPDRRRAADRGGLGRGRRSTLPKPLLLRGSVGSWAPRSRPTGWWPGAGPRAVGGACCWC